jgi:hypothetical protein
MVKDTRLRKRKKAAYVYFCLAESLLNSDGLTLLIVDRRENVGLDGVWDRKGLVARLLDPDPVPVLLGGLPS